MQEARGQGSPCIRAAAAPTAGKEDNVCLQAAVQGPWVNVPALLGRVVTAMLRRSRLQAPQHAALLELCCLIS